MASLSIGEVAEAAGVNIQTIRYYERIGLIPKPERKESGYRKFTGEDVHRLQFIQHAKMAGFLLREIEELLELKIESEANCSDVRMLCQKKIAEIDSKIDHLNTMKQTLGRLIASCDYADQLDQCPILQAFESEDFGAR